MKYKCTNIVECKNVKINKTKSLSKKITFNLSIVFCIFLCLNICFASLIYNSNFSIVLKNLTSNFLINPENFGKLKFVNSNIYGDKVAGTSEGENILFPILSPQIEKVYENNSAYYKISSSGNSVIFSPISGKIIKLFNNNKHHYDIIIENDEKVKILLSGEFIINVKCGQKIKIKEFIGTLYGTELIMKVITKNGNLLDIM